MSAISSLSRCTDSYSSAFRGLGGAGALRIFGLTASVFDSALSFQKWFYFESLVLVLLSVAYLFLELC